MVMTFEPRWTLEINGAHYSTRTVPPPGKERKGKERKGYLYIYMKQTATNHLPVEQLLKQYFIGNPLWRNFTCGIFFKSWHKDIILQVK